MQALEIDDGVQMIRKAMDAAAETYQVKRFAITGYCMGGKRDAWINEEKVSQLRELAAKYNLPVEVVSYDADHAFFNDTRPEVYNAEAAADAWRRVLSHFQKHLLQFAARTA